MPLQEKIGTRTYVLARPYILEPDYKISANIYPQAAEQSVIGEVTEADWVGMRQKEIGQAQAWFYPQEHILVLWECFLNDQYQAEDPRNDQLLHSLWKGFETFLLSHFPQVEQIVTPSGEPLYDHQKDAWPEFLQALGYQNLGKQAFSKNIKSTI